MKKPESIKLAGVLGNPISHSLSPHLHGFWINKYSVNGYYIPLLVNRTEIGKSLDALKTLGFRGANVTIPFKEEVIKYIDYISETDAKIGAVNTLSINIKGEITGLNTDVYGFLKNLEKSIPQWEKFVDNIVVIGAGGASRAVVSALKYKKIESKKIVNRSAERANFIKDQIDENLEIISWSQLDEVLENCDLLINTTPLGMNGQPPLNIRVDLMNKGSIVYDLVYTPLETNLIKSAKENNLQTVNGLGMLIFQAIKGFEEWFGKKPQADEATSLFLKRILQ